MVNEAQSHGLLGPAHDVGLEVTQIPSQAPDDGIVVIAETLPDLLRNSDRVPHS